MRKNENKQQRQSMNHEKSELTSLGKGGLSNDSTDSAVEISGCLKALATFFLEHSTKSEFGSYW